MFEEQRDFAFSAYKEARRFLCEHSDILIELEHFMATTMFALLDSAREEIIRDYNEASRLYPFWQNYPPDDRGRQPVGDQYPWIEVGEHAIGAKLPRLLAQKFVIYDYGIPVGPDERFVLQSEDIRRLTEGWTDSLWLFSDIKSVGPRDDAMHAVMSHNQITGSGKWNRKSDVVKNDVMIAKGQRAQHDFHCSIPPIYILSDGRVVPVINVVVKPLYAMISPDNPQGGGQPLSKITLATIPNGLLLEEGPRYLQQYPSLLFPGKDDKGMNPLKLRARVDFEILKEIADWRIQVLNMSGE